VKAYRAQLFHALSDETFEYYEDGVLLVRDDGHVETVGPAAKVLSHLPKDHPVEHYPDHLLLPGFIDTHVHYSQLDVIGSPARDTLQWLERHTFPAESKFASVAHAQEIAHLFVKEILKHGTTSALCFATSHAHSVDAIFHAAEKQGLRLAAGKVMMDRNSPASLADTAESSISDSKALIEKWRGKGRLQYAITPRFAPTSTDEQLRGAAELLRQYPEVLLQTHLAETPDEMTWVKQLYPKAKSYLGVYDQFGITSERTVFAHGIYLAKEDFALLAERGSGIAFCPSSNLFLGSGLFPWELAREAKIKLGLATDVGGGTSLSMWRTMALGHHVVQLQGLGLSAVELVTLATYGSAHLLGWGEKVGNFVAGREADFVVWNPHADALLSRRWSAAKSIEERLFAMLTLGDDRHCKASYILGNRAHG